MQRKEIFPLIKCCKIFRVKKKKNNNLISFPFDQNELCKKIEIRKNILCFFLFLLLLHISVDFYQNLSLYYSILPSKTFH